MKCVNRKLAGHAPANFLSNLACRQTGFKYLHIMKKEEWFNDDFLKQFKSGDELNGF